MGSPTIFLGRRTRVLSADGILHTNNSKNDFDGVPNYIFNGHAEVNTTGWATYADAAGSAPVDGTGGSPNVTLTRTTTSPLSGQASFLITKDAVNRQGQGASYNFTIDRSMQAKPLTISFDYIVASGTFVAAQSAIINGDITVWVYDVTNALLIQPSNIQLYTSSTTVPDSFSAQFQSASNSTSYRLIFHCATTSASAYALMIDSVSVSPSAFLSGIVMTDSTVTTNGFTAVTTSPTKGTIAVDKFAYSRMGDKVIIQSDYVHTTAGTAGSGQYLLNLPSGMSFDLSKTHYDSSNGQTLGACSVSQQADGVGNISHIGICYAYSATQIGFKILSQAAGTNTFTKWNDTNGANFSATNLKVSANIVAHISGWSANSQVSDQSDQKVIAMNASGAIADVTANNPIIFSSVLKDTNAGSYSTVTGKYTCQSSGWYQIESSVSAGSTTAARINTYINDVLSKQIGAYTGTGLQMFTASGLEYLNAGQTLDIRPNSAITGFASTGSLSIYKVSGPNQISATEAVALSAKNSSALSITNNTLSDVTSWTSDLDTHSSFVASTGVYTVPTAGIYAINFQLTFAQNGTGTRQLSIVLNGTTVSRIETAGNASISVGNSVFYVGRLKAQDVVKCQVLQNSGGALALDANAFYNQFHITRCGL